MKQLLLNLKDKTRINDLKTLGNVTYVSDYTSLIGFECSEDVVAILERHPNVDTVEDAETGSLQL